MVKRTLAGVWLIVLSLAAMVNGKLGGFTEHRWIAAIEVLLTSVLFVL